MNFESVFKKGKFLKIEFLQQKIDFSNRVYVSEGL